LPVAEFRGTRFSSISTFVSTGINGNRLPYAPEHLVNATFGYAHRSGFDALIEAVRISDQFGDDLNLTNPLIDSRFTDATLSTATRNTRLNLARSGQLGSIPASTVWNATVNYNAERLNTTFFITAKNLFDQLYIADRSRGILPGTPRLVQGGVKYRF
jgi:Fe(3+) dicitrate transport protein